jgi:addiction module HigA family antidote
MLPTHRPPTHPGEILLEDYLLPRKMSQVDLAEKAELPIQRINMIVNGRRGITPDTAVLISDVLKTRPEFWLQLQLNFDLWHALHDLGRTG